MEKREVSSKRASGDRCSSHNGPVADMSRSSGTNQRLASDGGQVKRTSLILGRHTVPLHTRIKRTSSHLATRRNKHGTDGAGLYIGGISRSGLCIFLLVVASIAFVTTFSLYMIFTVYGPTNLVVYSGDAVKIAYSSSWCKSFRCQEKAVNDSTELIQLFPSSDLVERERFVSYGPLPLRENTDHLLVLPVSDGAKIDLYYSTQGWCVASTILIFKSRSEYDIWLDSSRSQWLSRETISCSGGRWSLVAVDGGELFVVIRPVNVVPGHVTVGLLNATVHSLTVANKSVVGVACSALNASCSVGLVYGAQFDYAVAAKFTSSSTDLADVYALPNNGVASKVRCECLPRSVLYLMVFGGIGIATILIIIAVIAYRSWRSRRLKSVADRSTAASTAASTAGPTDGTTAEPTAGHDNGSESDDEECCLLGEDSDAELINIEML